LQHECSNTMIDECSPCMNRRHMESVVNELQGYSSRMLYITTDCEVKNPETDQSVDDVLNMVKHYLKDETQCNPKMVEEKPFECPEPPDLCDFTAQKCQCGLECLATNGGKGQGHKRLLDSGIQGEIFKSEAVAGLPAAIQGERPWQPLPMLACFVAGLLIQRLVGKISRRDERHSTPLQTSLGEE